MYTKQHSTPKPPMRAHQSTETNACVLTAAAHPEAFTLAMRGHQPTASKDSKMGTGPMRHAHTRLLVDTSRLKHVSFVVQATSNYSQHTERFVLGAGVSCDSKSPQRTPH